MKAPNGMKILTTYVTIEEYRELQMLKNQLGIEKAPDFYKMLIEVGFCNQSNGKHLGSLLENKEQKESEHQSKITNTEA